MKNITISQMMLLKDKTENTKYRVLNITESYAVLINTETTHRLDIIVLSVQILQQKIMTETMEFIVEPEEKTVVDMNNLPETARIKYARNKNIIEAINLAFAPDYTGLIGRSSKPVLNELIRASGMSRKSVWRIIIS